MNLGVDKQAALTVGGRVCSGCSGLVQCAFACGLLVISLFAFIFLSMTLACRF